MNLPFAHVAGVFAPLDLALERGVELDEARAQRAVAAGQGARLERQLTGAGGDADYHHG